MGNWTRRRVLQACIAGAGGALWPGGAIIAQSGGSALLSAPKQALVIGNSKYRHAPLKNPVNDANGMAAVLKGVGFGVALGLDLTQAAMREAMQAFGENLSRSKAVGVFYFAGHGAQLAWRNYLLPVDAEISDIQELRERGVDLNSLIDGIRKAGNPMNVIILDACRDNPFGNLRGVDQKGLAQMDAPTGTLLAYSTSPGNVAGDGDGVHGIYTEQLLREIKVPEARVEDVFKRVRVGVRRKSNGAQIPWESTSLEDDFYFLPPAHLKKLSEDEKEKRFNDELAIWERIKDSKEPAPFEDYLRTYPSGHFAELAQFQLDRVLALRGEKKIRIVSATDNPYSKGTVSADTNFKVGDSYTYSVTDLFTKIETKRLTETITRITDSQVVYDSGRLTDLLGNILRYSSGQVSTGSQFWGVDYALGKRWTARTRVTTARGNVLQTESELRVTAREKITVPAGTFNAFVVESQGWAIGTGINTQLVSKRWIAPDQVRVEIAVERLRRASSGKVILSEREELVSYRQT